MEKDRREMHPSRSQTRKILRGYLTERRSLSDTSRQYGIKRGVVERVLKQGGHKLRPVGEAVRLAKIGRPRPTLTLATHPGERTVDKWKIVELRIAGKSNQEIAKLLNRAWPSIYIALRGMGFPVGTGVSACYSFGELFDRAALRRLRQISGFNVTSLAEQLGVPFATLEVALSTRKSQSQMHLKTARKASEWRASLFRSLMSNASRHPGRQTDKYGQSRVIVTFFPNLRARYLCLLEVLHQLGKKLRDNPEWSLDRLQQHLCEQAMGEKAGISRGDLFRRFLPWAPELTPFLAGKLQDLQGVRYQRIAWEILAGSLGTTAPIISAVINPAQAQRIRPIPPEEMRWLILKLAAAAPTLQIGRKREDAVAARVAEVKKTMSWGKLTIKLNEEARRSGSKQRTEEGYRSLYRSRKTAPG
jgi:hypothetical protein